MHVLATFYVFIRYIVLFLFFLNIKYSLFSCTYRTRVLQTLSNYRSLFNTDELVCAAWSLKGGSKSWRAPRIEFFISLLEKSG